MASGTITSWQIDGESMETVADFIFSGSKALQTVTAAMKLKDTCSLEENYDQLRQHIKKQSYYFTNQDVSSQSCCFSSSHVYVCENWIIKKAECQRMDTFELWCWRRILRVPWTARRKQSILKEINLEYSLEGLMLKLKLQYFGHWMQRTDIEKESFPDAGKD